MSLHPSRFPKRADGTRFTIREGDLYDIRDAKGEPVAICPTRKIAEMVAAALELQARDGETFILEDGKNG